MSERFALLSVTRPMGRHPAFTAGAPLQSLCEFAARVCYHSDDQMGRNPSFLAQRCTAGHLDVLEHAQFTFAIPNLDRHFAALAPMKGWQATQVGTQEWFLTLNARHILFEMEKALGLALKVQVWGYFPGLEGHEGAVNDPKWQQSVQIPDLEAPSDGDVTLLAVCKPSRLAPDNGGMTFMVNNISRACSHEWVRHRLLSFSQESQRYVSLEKGAWPFIRPKSISENDRALDIWNDFHDDAVDAYSELLALGIRKEDARFVLPNSTGTRMVVSGSMAAWNHFLNLRLAPAAQWEIRQHAGSIARLKATYG